MLHGSGIKLWLHGNRQQSTHLANKAKHFVTDCSAPALPRSAHAPDTRRLASYLLASNLAMRCVIPAPFHTLSPASSSWSNRIPSEPTQSAGLPGRIVSCAEPNSLLFFHCRLSVCLPGLQSC